MAAKGLCFAAFMIRLACMQHAKCRAFSFAFRSTAAHSSRIPCSYKYSCVYPVNAGNKAIGFPHHFPDTRQQYPTRLFAAAAENSDHSFLNGLNEAQVEAVTQPLSSITRVVAGPGAGKTRVLTSRIAYLLQHDETDRRILAVTFTKKAAAEMQQRLEKLLTTTRDTEPIEQSNSRVENDIVQEEVAGAGYAPRPSTALDRVTLGTFHSVCAKILRWNGKHLAALPSVVKEMTGVANATSLDGSFAIMDQGEQVRIVKECAVELGIDLKSQDLKPQTMLNAIAKVKASLAMGQDPLKSGRKVPPKTIKVGVKLYPLYRQKLLARNALDFDDLILMARELLTVHDDIRDHLRRRWQHVLVDEFQDTSQSQLDLVKLLSSDSLLVVGDADQSIYSWRGAHAESMSDFIYQFDDRLDGVNTVHLMENYRSTTNIVSAAQKIISSDSASSKQADLRQNMKPMRGSGPTPRVLACADAKAEASFVVQTIEDLMASGDYNSDSTVAIVYRTNAQSRAIEEACVQANLPYVVRGSSGAFYKRAEIQDCLCFLRLLRNGRDEAAMKRAIKTPSRGIGNVAYQEFSTYCQKVEEFYESSYPDLPKPTPFDVLLSLTDDQNSNDPSGLVQDAPLPSEFISKRALNRFIPFSSQMRLIRSKARTLTVAGLLSSIIVNLELRSHIDSISKSSSEFSDRWSNVIELRRAAQRYSEDGASLPNVQESEDDTEEQPAESPLGNFLDDVALVTDMADDVSDSDGAEKRLVVNLMTIHASKGMEFDGVFLVGNEDGTLPTKLAIMEGEGSVALDEEKRLCYVAMTRAKTHLIMTWRREVSLFTGNIFTTVKASRSRFLDILVGKGGKNSKGSKQEARGQGSSKRRHSAGAKQAAGRRVDPRSSSLPRAGTPSTFPRARPANGARRDLTTTEVKRIRNTERIQTPRRKEKAVSQASATRKKQPHEIKVRATLGRQAQAPKPRNGSIRTVNTGVQKRKVPAATSGSDAMEKKQPHEIKVRATLGKQAQAPKPRNGSTQTASARIQKQKVPTGSAGTDTMDSTWFYPIGSSVVHTRHGNGRVLPPPPSKQGMMLVRVQFENGTKHDFPADVKDLHLNFT